MKLKSKRMKNKFLLAAFFLSTFASFAQDYFPPKQITEPTQERKKILSISLGFCAPTGDFASSNVNDPKSGLASTGAVFDLSFTYMINSNWGISSTIRGQNNPLNVNAIKNYYSANLPIAQWFVESDGWGNSSFLIGGIGSFELDSKNKFFFEGKAMIGFANSNSPKITIKTDYGFNGPIIEISSVRGYSSSFLIGAGIKYNKNEKRAWLLTLTTLRQSQHLQELKPLLILVIQMYIIFHKRLQP